MTTLSFEQGSPQWHKYRKLAQTDLYWLCDVVLGLGPLVPMRDRVHKVFLKFMERTTGEPELDNAPIHLALMPRETGKTSLWTKARPIQLLCRDPNRSIILANEKEDNARKFLGTIKQQFESNEMLRALFPELIPDDLQSTVWRGTEINVKRTTTRQEPSVMATGVGGSIVGMHPDDLLIDDMISIEAMRNAKVGARQVIEGVNDWIHTLPFLPNKNAHQWGINFVGCIARGEPVLMGDGTWKPIEQVVVGDKVQSWDYLSHECEAKTVSGVWPQGKADVVRITTDRHTVVATPTHPFLTELRDATWTKAEFLQPGQEVFTLKTLSEPWKEQRTEIQGFGPSTDDMLWLFGWLWGDGWVTKYVGKTAKRGTSYCVCFALGVHEELNERGRRLMQQYLGGRVYDTATSRTARMDCNEAGRRMEAIGLTPGVHAPDKQLPPWIWSLTPHEKRAFLKGLVDADGWEHPLRKKGKQGYRLSGASRELIHGVYWLALTCNWKPTKVWHRRRLCQAPGSPEPTVADEYTLDLRVETDETRLRPSKIKSIEPIEGQREVYDLTVEDNANFITAGFVVHNTHWWHDDCYDHAIAFFSGGETPREYLIRCRLEDGSVQTIRAYRAGQIAWMIRSAVEENRSIFPEKWSMEDLATMRMNDPVLFGANMMNQPSDDVTSEFKEAWLRTFRWVDEDRVEFVDGAAKTRNVNVFDLDRVILVDPGGFATVGHSDRMRAGIVLTGSTTDGLHVLLRTWSEKDTYLNAIKQIVVWAKRYQVRKIVVEQTAQQMAFLELLKRELAAAMVMSVVEPITPKGKAKEQRILELEPFFQQGRVYIGGGPESMEFRAQYSQFPRALRRDLLDVLAYGPYIWRRVTPPSNTHEQRQAKEREMVRARMAGTMSYGGPLK